MGTRTISGTVPRLLLPWRLPTSTIARESFDLNKRPSGGQQRSRQGICFDDCKAPSFIEVDGAKELAVEIFSLSKSYNMADWRVGFCLGIPHMR